MKITQRLQAAVQGFRTANNSMGQNLGRQFLKYGNRQPDPSVQDWAQLLMRDEDFYTGHGYSAINNRANRVVTLATEHLKTKAKQSVMDEAKQSGADVKHPYLQLIEDSSTFSDDVFWYMISTYLDLQGVFYLFVLRNGEGKRIGTAQEFKLLNPYDITRVYSNSDTTKVEGYIEIRDGMSREIPPHMIIEMRKLNPFRWSEPFSMSDAAKDAQFTLKQSGDHMRNTIGRNNKFPGIVQIGESEITLDPEQLANFKARVLSKDKRGEPIFATGVGSPKWADMQLDLRKSLPDLVQEVNMRTLTAVTGNSKTMAGIEESGTTRDTSKTQKDLFTENHAIPQARLIISALNQDYKNSYPDEYKKNGYKITIDNPLGTDHDAEEKDIQNRMSSQELYKTLRNDGYSHEIAAKYANGEIGLMDIGEPTEKPEPTTVVVSEDSKADTPSTDTTTNTVVLNAPSQPRKSSKEVTSYDYPQVYESLGIDTDKLGFVMLDTKPFEVTKYVEGGEDDLFYGEAGSFKDGAVAEKTAHVTLMFGLMENANDWKKEIGIVLDDWSIRNVEIQEVGYFSNDDSEDVPIVAHVKPTDKLLEGNMRLKLLPHINTFPDYRPHITLAYVKNDPAVVKKWVSTLGKELNGKRVSIDKGINYGEKNFVQHIHKRDHAPTIKNQFSQDDQGTLDTQQGMLQNAIVNIEEKLVATVLNRVTKNQFEEQSDIISKEEKEAFENELEIALAAFYGIILPLYARNVLSRRVSEFGMFADFKLNSSVQSYIKDAAKKASVSHVNTITEDLLETIKKTEKSLVDRAVEEIKQTPEATGKTDEQIYKLARKKALEGAGRQEIASAIRREYSEISTNRAKAIARTETNRAFTQSQFQADKQFIKQNNLEGRAYKKWITRSGNPCALCLEKAAQPPIPFDKAFAELGDEITATEEVDGKTRVLKQKITYETVEAGNLHVNCSCIYQLIVE
jgi:2'-5' RNA ligase